MKTAIFLAVLGSENDPCECAQQQRSYVWLRAFEIKNARKGPVSVQQLHRKEIGGCGTWVGGIVAQSRLRVFIVAQTYALP